MNHRGLRCQCRTHSYQAVPHHSPSLVLPPFIVGKPFCFSFLHISPPYTYMVVAIVVDSTEGRSLCPWIFFFFIIFYILCLHSKWIYCSWFPISHKSHKPSSLQPFPNQPPPTSLSWKSPTMLHQAFPRPGPFPSFLLGNDFICELCLGYSELLG